jgi:hypothetical protein
MLPEGLKEIVSLAKAEPVKLAVRSAFVECAVRGGMPRVTVGVAVKFAPVRVIVVGRKL